MPSRAAFATKSRMHAKGPAASNSLRRAERGGGGRERQNGHPHSETPLSFAPGLCRAPPPFPSPSARPPPSPSSDASAAAWKIPGLRLRRLLSCLCRVGPSSGRARFACSCSSARRAERQSKAPGLAWGSPAGGREGGKGGRRLEGNDLRHAQRQLGCRFSALRSGPDFVGLAELPPSPPPSFSGKLLPG